MPGHNYTGPGNSLEQQLRYDPNTGQIVEIYQQPTCRTDAVSLQHDVDYSVCGNKSKSDQVKCKNDADRKMVKALDSFSKDISDKLDPFSGKGIDIHKAILKVAPKRVL